MSYRARSSTGRSLDYRGNEMGLQFDSVDSEKIVLKLDYADEKIKQKAMQKVSGLSGLESISLDSKEKKMTITGDIDPVTAASKLRKLCPTEIVSVGLDKEPEKKKEEQKKVETKKGEAKKDDDKKEAPKAELPPWMKAYQAYNNYPNYYYQQQPYQQSLVAAAAPPHYYSRAVVEEDPNQCVIC